MAGRGRPRVAKRKSTTSFSLSDRAFQRLRDIVNDARRPKTTTIELLIDAEWERLQCERKQADPNYVAESEAAPQSATDYDEDYYKNSAGEPDYIEDHSV